VARKAGTDRDGPEACRMKRIAACSALVMLAFIAPAHAATPYSYKGSVLLPAGIAPTAARGLHNITKSNDHIVADIFRLPADADGKFYTLKTTAGLTTLENPDVYFAIAAANGDPGTLCTQDYHEPDPKTETGSICPKATEQAAWAIVVLRIGAASGFTFSY
jgi:hypothetical protein